MKLILTFLSLFFAAASAADIPTLNQIHFEMGVQFGLDRQLKPQAEAALMGY